VFYGIFRRIGSGGGRPGWSKVMHKHPPTVFDLLKLWRGVNVAWAKGANKIDLVYCFHIRNILALINNLKNSFI